MKTDNGALIIFIDSFPFYNLNRTEYLNSFPIRYKVTPGFGYSINIQAEIFSGKSPDKLGYFCQWGYSPSGSDFKKWGPLFQVINPVRNFYYLDRLAHRVIGKFTGNIGNIPFSYLPSMKKVSADVFEKGFQSQCLFTDFPSIKLISFREFSHLPVHERDRGVFEKTLQSIPDHQYIVATLVDLDGLAHQNGIDSPIYQKRLTELDEWIYSLSEPFFKKNPQGTIVVVSDHGIAPVRSGVNLELEKKFGKPSPKKYFYFVDATILRIWGFDDMLVKEMESFLKDTQAGSLLTDEERKAFGLTDPSLATLIFQLNEQLMFSPSFWGRGRSHAMHGYHPELESQKGVCLVLQREKISGEPSSTLSEIRTTKVYQILYNVLKEAHTC